MEGREHVAYVRRVVDEAIEIRRTVGRGALAMSQMAIAGAYFARYTDEHAAPDVINMQRMAREILRYYEDDGV